MIRMKVLVIIALINISSGIFLNSPQFIRMDDVKGSEGDSEYIIIPITDNQLFDRDPKIHDGLVTWLAYDGNDYEIFYFDSETGITTQITNNVNNDYDPQIDYGLITWYGGGPDFEIFLYDTNTGITTQITDNSYYDYNPQITYDHVTWYAWDGNDYEIFLYDITTRVISQVTDNIYDDINPQIHDIQVTWVRDYKTHHQIFLYDYDVAVITQVTDNTNLKYLPQIFKDGLTWYEWDGYDYEIFYYNTHIKQIIQVSDNNYDDVLPQVSGGQVTWQGNSEKGWEIFLFSEWIGYPIQITDNYYLDAQPDIEYGQVIWHGRPSGGGSDLEIFLYNFDTGQIFQLTNDNFDDTMPKIHEKQLTWLHWDGNDYEVYFAKPGVSPPNQPPLCSISLEIDGTENTEIDVGEFFDIYVGDSTDDTGIFEVRFSSDDDQNGVATGEWTDWFDWDITFEDWDALTKIKRWAFATGGDKEVWVEIKDDIGQTCRDYDLITAIQDTTAPTIFAEFHEIEADSDEGLFEVNYEVTDDRDPNPHVEAVIKVPNVNDPKPDFKIRDEIYVEFDLKDNKITVEGPDPESIWQEIQELGGLEVIDGQQVFINTRTDSKLVVFSYEEGLLKIDGYLPTLQVTAQDEAGNIGSDNVIPVFKVHILLLVHGFYTDSNSLSEMEDYFDEYVKYGTGERIYTPDLYQGEIDISIPIGPGAFTHGDNSYYISIFEDNLAIRLWEYMRIQMTETKEYHFDIVAHSMGGLVTRAMIEFYAGGSSFEFRTMTHYIDNVAFVATPNQGIDIPNWIMDLVSWHEALKDARKIKLHAPHDPLQLIMMDNSPIDGISEGGWISENLPNYLPEGINYFVYGGLKSYCDKDIIEKKEGCALIGIIEIYLPVNNDGVVPIISIHLGGALSSWSGFYNHFEIKEADIVMEMIRDNLILTY